MTDPNLLLEIRKGGILGRQIVIGYEHGGSCVFDVASEVDLDVPVGNLIEIDHTNMSGFVYRVTDLGPPPPLTRPDWLEARADDEPW